MSDSPLEAYLDQLFAQAGALPPREARHLLAEAEEHLRDETERGVAAGLERTAAERAAVDRFGPVHEVVGAEARRQGVPLRVLVREVFATALLLGAVGALAVGASGVIALVIGLIGGNGALAAVRPDQVLAPADCARWLALSPHATSCRAAAIEDWAGEVVTYRIAMGLLGAVALALFWALRRRPDGRRRWALLPGSVVDTIAMCLFGAAGVWTLALGVDALVTQGGSGAGQWLSAAPVALAAATVYGLRLVSDLRRAPAQVSPA
ncbi:MAG TPA: permease prefix domain 1-containing protein [Actinomycetes bacterium]|nr:permease prefix domain 1-containing protein [Actinomycetes bacterium]